MLRFIVDVNLFFPNSRIVFCFVAILFSSMQCVEGFLVSLKGFGYRFSAVFKRLITSKIKDVMNVDIGIR